MLEGLPLEKLHGDEGTPFEFTNIVNDADIGVIEGGGGTRLAMEALDGLGVLRNVIGEEFEGDVAAEAGIFGFVDHAHTAAAEFFEDGVMGDGGADDGGGVRHGGVDSTTAVGWRQTRWANAAGAVRNDTVKVEKYGLFVAEGEGGGDVGGAASGNVGGENGDEEGGWNDDQINEDVDAAGVEEHGIHEAFDDEAHQEANRSACADEHETFGHHHAQYVGGSGTKGHADPDFARSAGHVVRHERVQAGDSQQQANNAHRGDEFLGNARRPGGVVQVKLLEGHRS